MKKKILKIIHKILEENGRPRSAFYRTDEDIEIYANEIMEVFKNFKAKEAK